MNAAEFRAAALGLPGVVEAAHMGHPDFRVRGKVFASLGYPDESWAMVKLTREQQRFYLEKAPAIFNPCNGAWGRQGCTNIHLASASKALLTTALGAAYENVARGKAPAKIAGDARAKKPRGEGQ